MTSVHILSSLNTDDQTDLKFIYCICMCMCVCMYRISVYRLNWKDCRTLSDVSKTLFPSKSKHSQSRVSITYYPNISHTYIHMYIHLVNCSSIVNRHTNICAAYIHEYSTFQLYFFIILLWCCFCCCCRYLPEGSHVNAEKLGLLYHHSCLLNTVVVSLLTTIICS